MTFINLGAEIYVEKDSITGYGISYKRLVMGKPTINQVFVQCGNIEHHFYLETSKHEWITMMKKLTRPKSLSEVVEQIDDSAEEKTC